MTNEKAIMCLEDMKIKVPIPKAAKQAMENNEALDVAIKALAESEHSTNLAEVGTDCISRQQAINALERAKQNIHHNIERAIGDAVCEVLDAVENGIKQLPPIHPVNNSEMPNGSDVISRQAAIDATKKHYRAHDNDLLELIAFDIEQLPSVQPETEWNNHTVACLLAELFGDDCACNYNGIDEWLPEKCEVIDACPNPVGVACWEQFLKHRAERRTDG